MDKADVWAEREGWIDWLFTAWNKVLTFLDNQTSLSILIFFIIFLQFIIILYMRKNFIEAEYKGFDRGWKARDKKING